MLSKDKQFYTNFKMSRFSEDQLQEVFDEIDEDKNGYINRTEVAGALRRLGISEKEVVEYTEVSMTLGKM